MGLALSVVTKSFLLVLHCHGNVLLLIYAVFLRSLFLFQILGVGQHQR